RMRSVISRALGAVSWAVQCCFEHADQIRLTPGSSRGQPPVVVSTVVVTTKEEGVVLEEDPQVEEIVARVAALDIGQAELVCCVRVPHEGKPGRRLQEGGYLLHDDLLAAGDV
ncbi:MAG: hypothetical protein LC776_17225, partial [Acidobacteria bacterium]|nr:hypothetical protein [Acidobacteriota bacterium]